MNKLKFTDDCIEIISDTFDEKLQDALEKLYPAHSNRKKTAYKVSIQKAPEVLKLLRNIDETNCGGAPFKIQEYVLNELSARETIADLCLNGPVGDTVVNRYLTLKPHQQLAREIAKVRNKFCFFYDTRTGKTPLSLTIINDDISANSNAKWLVVCPLILINNAWLEDAKKFFPDMTIINCHAATAKQRLIQIGKTSQVYITNTESFASYKSYFYDMHFTGCFVDESSSMKSAKTDISNSLVEFAQTMKRFYLLSGTPAPNGEWEYYCQLRAVDYYSVPSSYTQYKQKYFVNLSYNPQYEKLSLSPTMHDDLYKILKTYAMYVDKEDVLTTPGRQFIEEKFDMPDDVAKHYSNIKKELYTELEGQAILANTAATKLNKLNQVSSGFLIDTQAKKTNKVMHEDLVETYQISDYRYIHLQRILDNDECRGQQVLIWANYHKEFEMIEAMLGDKCMSVYGKKTLQEKDDAIQAFKKGRVQYLVANPASADKGLTLTNTHIAVYFSLNWSYELFKQSKERIYGDISSQPKFCFYYIMLANKSIDVMLYDTVLQGKQLSSMEVLNHLKPEALLK